MIRLLCSTCLLPVSAFADVPAVMTDIAPVHSIAAQVMGDLGTPDLLLPPGADPHDFALRPSDAARLGDAELVIWVGEGLTPWLSEPLETLAPQAAHISLLDVPGWEQLDIRDVKDHGGHDDHKEHDDHDDHEEHEEHADDHAHDHGDFDPHAWLDPKIAGVWAQEIATQLGSIDPANAAIYNANADAAVTRFDALSEGISAQLAAVTDKAYVLPHDGYQYFEARFGLTAQAAIAGIDARSPGPAQIGALRDDMAANNVVCVFSDVAIGDRWAAVITEGTSANTVQIDGIGRGLEAGPALYEAMMSRLADGFETCLGNGM